MSEKRLKLSARLMTIAAFVENGSEVADIGTDHGYLPVYLAQTGLARKIIASDISAESLEAARSSAIKYGVYDKITFIVAPGLTGVGESEADTVVLAGMGGETISSILSGATWTKRRSIKIIMQPQTKTNKLCSWLRDNGYVLIDAELTHDKGRFYTVILAHAQNAPGLEIRTQAPGCGELAARDSFQSISSVQNSHDPEMELLSLLAGKNNPHFIEYIDKLILKARRAADGMEKSGSAGYNDMIIRLENLNAMRNSARSVLRKCRNENGGFDQRCQM